LDSSHSSIIYEVEIASMPPKPTPLTKSESAKDALESKLMPPPPDPPAPQAILEAEASALAVCLKVRISKSFVSLLSLISHLSVECGSKERPNLPVLWRCSKAVSCQAFGTAVTDSYYSHIQHHAPKAPRFLTAALGREIEKYNQIVDAMESHIVCNTCTWPETSYAQILWRLKR
jgi:hypothetical protein